jgi:hypothetical protein
MAADTGASHWKRNAAETVDYDRIHSRCMHPSGVDPRGASCCL